MRFLGTRANQNFFRAKLGLVTHENRPMRFFGSRAILEVLRQKLNSRLSVLKREKHDYEGKKGEKREKEGEKRERREKTVEAKVGKVRCDYFSPSSMLFK